MRPKRFRQLDPIALSATPTDSSGGVWNVLAYEVNLRGSNITLTRRDFEVVIANFAKYPKVPLVIEHADTDWCGDDEMAAPHGWVVELRIGEFERPDGRRVASLEGRLVADECTKLLINGDGKNPPTYPFGSVTIIDAWDEETDTPSGLALWSFSLTAHPRLVDVPRLAASMPLPTDSRVGVVAPIKHEEIMKTFLQMAAQHGIAAKDEDDAREKLLALAAEAPEVRKALGLTLAAPASEVVAKLAGALVEASKVPALTAALAGHEKAASERADADRAAHIEALVASKPELGTARTALEAYAKSDYAAFSLAYPKPTPAAHFEAARDAGADKRERAKDPGRLAPLPGGNARTQAPDTSEPTGEEFAEAATMLMAKYRAQGIELSYQQAVEAVCSGSSPELPDDSADDTDDVG